MIKNYLKNIDISALLVAIYTSIVWGMYIYLKITPSKKAVIFFGVIIGIVSYFLIKFLMDRLRKFNITSKKELLKKEKIVIFAVSSLIVFGVMMICFWGYCPGSFSADSIDQFSQAVSGKYVDWHPVWHTLVFFTLPLKLFGTPASIIIMQLIYFSLVLGYLTLTISEISNLKIAIISLAYILLNPYIIFIMLYPWKDVGFALGGLLAVIILVRLIFKVYKINLLKLILFGGIIASTTIFRHNAILYTAPLLIVLLCNIDKKIWTKIFVFTVMTFFIIKVPVYHFIGVTKPQQRIVETMGLPLTVIGNVAKETPQLMDEELSEFAYSMATPQQWQENYICGDFNSIKWSGIDTSVVEKEGYAGMLHLMFKCFRSSPNASINAVIALTDMVYGFENGLDGDVSADIVDNSYGIAYSESRNINCQGVISVYSLIVNNSILRYFRTYGVCLFVILIVVLGKLKFKSWISWKKAIVVIPIFSYDFGTMLLLTGSDSRFFFITFLVTPLLIVYALCSEKGNESNE